jgi:membrane protease YdiL (CAAX protease family)
MWYVADRGIPPEVAWAVLPAFLLEVVLYVLSGVPAVRERLTEMADSRIALLLTALAPASYALLSLPLGVFDPLHLGAVTLMGAMASFWYVTLPRSLGADLGYLALIAAPILFKTFDQFYPDPTPRVPGQIVGALMWYRTMLVSVLCIRRMDGIGFGFLPERKDWLIGVRNFLWFLVPGVALALAIEFTKVKDVRWDGRLLLLTLLTFAGGLWVLAVAEEFIFRGLLQQHLARLFRSNTAGLVVASLIFGSGHLAYRQFPNWKFALLATLAGMFYGRAFLQAGSIRAAMVTHALVFTTWKMFFS